MWEQSQSEDRPKPLAPLHNIVMVNARGRVVGATNLEAQKLIGDGFHYAPENAKIGSYLPVYDRGDHWKNEDFIAPEIVEKLAPDILDVIEI